MRILLLCAKKCLQVATLGRSMNKTSKTLCVPHRFALGKNRHQLNTKDEREKPEESREGKLRVCSELSQGHAHSVPGTTKVLGWRAQLSGRRLSQ